MKNSSSARKESSYFVLLVDDNNHGLIVRKAVLEEVGYKVSTAHNAAEALEMYASRRFDLVVTDYKMPKMNGVEFIQEIRRTNVQAKIILLSGFVEPLGLDEKSTGADIVLSKSSGEVGNLLRAANRLLAKRVEKKPPASQKGPGRNKAKGTSGVG